MRPEERCLELAREAGFDLAGLAPIAPPPDARHFERWLDLGRHAGMDWLERQRERIVDPARIRPGARSLLIVGLAHARAACELPSGGRVARYAAGRDYHNLMGKRLAGLAKQLAAAGLVHDWRAIVDAGPLLERSHAAAAGLGFPSKAANLLHPRFGPWFFLGELLIDAELEPTGSPPAGSCGTCTACLDACPTEAIVAPGEVDATRCISYHTIESSESAPRELRAAFGEWAFGCDVCSEVCPWGKDAPDLAARFGTHPAVASDDLVTWLELRGDFSEHWNGSPLQRPKREGLARNAAIALASVRSDVGRRGLLRALSFDPAPMVREAAGWALARGYGEDAETRPELERAWEREPDPEVRRDLRRSLDGEP